jgi:beta-lactamase superfamily II metal-dependent hydrolase
MGRTKYGDCILVQSADKTILIDGGHPGDYKDRDDRPSIPSQLEKVLGHEAPFHFDLLVVTHCHQDHIGCLPYLVANDIITCDRALVADEKLGFGLDDGGQGDARLAAVGPRIRNLVAALSEEDHANLRGAELEEFLADAASLQDNYNSMLRTLGRNVDVVRYRQGSLAEQRAVTRLVADMSATELRFFGPTAAQLVHCAEVIQRASGDAVEMLADMGDPSETLGETYLRVLRSVSDESDAIHHEVGWAKNCQSIVMAFGPEGERVLLPGDMQFAEPGIPAIDNLVQELRSTVSAGGPYIFVKTPHHTSHNGTNEEILGEWGWPPLLGHSGGYNDPTHPFPKTLALLKTLLRQHEFTYARTDRNGLVTVDPVGHEISGERNRLNDFTPNVARDAAIAAQPARSEEEASARTIIATAADRFVEITFVRIPYATGQVSVDNHRIEIARAESAEPSRIAPVAAESASTSMEQPVVPRSNDPGPTPRRNVLAGGRVLPKLVFVTDPDRLRRNIGEDADHALALVRQGGHRVVAGAAPTLIAATRTALQDVTIEGVVLLGGYDVVPSQRVDVLGPDLRTRMTSSLIARDPDGFVVWSDDAYGDRDADLMPEVPVSRIPDARLGSLLLGVLTAPAVGRAGKFGLRNRERPFAEPIYASIPGNDPIQISEPQGPSAAQRDAAARIHVYFMLHGDYRNSTTFWGESDDGATPAIDVPSLPSANIGVAFAGCCWGALTVSEPAFLAGTEPTPRMVERSIALSLLRAGAQAFVGATGVHYSPGDTGGFFGGPLHAAFWDEIRKGRAPAPALFNARRSYLLEIPHGRTALWNLAVERKLYKEFTCLGLGW